MKKIVYDMKLKRPACALLQVVLGGDLGIVNQIPSEQWLLVPTKDMKCYAITDEQFSSLIRVHRGKI